MAHVLMSSTSHSDVLLYSTSGSAEGMTTEVFSGQRAREGPCGGDCAVSGRSYRNGGNTS